MFGSLVTLVALSPVTVSLRSREFRNNMGTSLTGIGPVGATAEGLAEGETEVLGDGDGEGEAE